LRAHRVVAAYGASFLLTPAPDNPSTASARSEAFGFERKGPCNRLLL
jgi:hypothetical protein